MIRIFFMLALSLAAAPPLRAQSWVSEKIGPFRYNPRFDEETGEDKSNAYVRAALHGEPVEERGGAGGDLKWFCHNDSLMIFIDIMRVHPGARSRMIYAFDQDAPDTVDVAPPWPASWGLPAEHNRAFTARARTARLLAVQLVNGRRRIDRVFEMDSADRVLGRLACVRGLEPPLPPDPREFDLADVPDPPRMINYLAVHQALAREYTAEQRAAHATGWVELGFRVMEDGSLDHASIRVVRSSDPQFEAGSLRVARMMRFVPGRVNGRAVITRATQVMQFATGP